MVSKYFHVRRQIVGSSVPKITILRPIIEQSLTLEENSSALLEHYLLANNFHGFPQYVITKGHITSHMDYKLFKTAEDQLIIMCTWMNKIFQGTHWIATVLFPSQKFTSFACLFC
jgi:hypothetical protein